MNICFCEQANSLSVGLIIITVLETVTWQNTPNSCDNTWSLLVDTSFIGASKFPCLNIWLVEVLTPPRSWENWMSAFSHEWNWLGSPVWVWIWSVIVLPGHLFTSTLQGARIVELGSVITNFICADYRQAVVVTYHEFNLNLYSEFISLNHICCSDSLLTASHVWSKYELKIIKVTRRVQVKFYSESLSLLKILTLCFLSLQRWYDFNSWIQLVVSLLGKFFIFWVVE